MYFDGHIRGERQRLLQPPLADETPWTDDVRDDVDLDGLGVRHERLLL